MAGVISTDVRLFGELHRRFRNIYHLQYIIKCILIQVSHPQYLFFSADCVAEKPVKCSRPEIKIQWSEFRSQELGLR